MASLIYPGERIIDDSTPDSFSAGNTFGTGYKGMFESAASAARFSELDPGFLIPRSEWQARIQEMEEAKTRISDLIVQAGLPPKNQRQTNYCWIFGPTGCVEIVRVVQGQKMVSLSPASAGAQIKKYRNEGGWGSEGMEWIAEKGLNTSEQWPDTAIERRYATAANQQAALEYRATEWDRLEPKSMDEMVSCLLRRKPVAIGLNWWGHQVNACDVLWLDGDVAIRIRNSWGDIPDFPNGFGILRGRKMIPDDACCLRSTTAS